MLHTQQNEWKSTLRVFYASTSLEQMTSQTATQNKLAETVENNKSSLCNERNTSANSVHFSIGKFKRYVNNDISKRQIPIVSVNVVNNEQGIDDDKTSTPVIHSPHNTSTKILLKTAVVLVWSDHRGNDINALVNE